MPYSVKWLIDEHIVILKGWGKITADEFLQGDSEIVDLMNTVAAGKVHLIADITGAQSMPPVSALRRGRMPKNEHFGYGVVVGHMNSLVRTITMLVASLTGMPYHNAPSVETAVELLQKLDPDLQNIAAHP